MVAQLCLQGGYRSMASAETKVLKMIKVFDDQQFESTGQMRAVPSNHFELFTLPILSYYQNPESYKALVQRAEEKYSRDLRDPIKLEAWLTAYRRDGTQRYKQPYMDARAARESLTSKIEELVLRGLAQWESNQGIIITRLNDGKTHLQLTAENFHATMATVTEPPPNEFLIQRVLPEDDEDIDLQAAVREIKAATAAIREVPKKKRGRPKEYRDGWCTVCPREEGKKPVSTYYSAPACADCVKIFSRLSIRAKKSPGCSTPYCSAGRPCNWCQFEEWVAKGFRSKLPSADDGQSSASSSTD
ncbi:unnamed protein product, partial [Mesorhabditis spiculigera]